MNHYENYTFDFVFFLIYIVKMSDIERILADKPDHEKRARAFIDAVNGYSRSQSTVAISVWQPGDEPLVNEFTDHYMPGDRDRLSDIDHQIEIRSVEQSSVMVDVNGYEADVANASIQIGALAGFFRGMQDLESEDVANEPDGKITDQLSFDFTSSD